MHSAGGSGRLVAGRYRLLHQLGRGAMGVVWRGRDELLDRDVAVKQIVLAPMASADEARAGYQRTLREARTAARLSHPGVITVFDVVEEDGMAWIVMELIKARPLDQVIAEDGPLPPAQAAQLGLSLLDALSSAHAAGVLHRDVKPSNVLITPEGKAVLTDFGIATVQGDPAMTQTGMVVGTPSPGLHHEADLPRLAGRGLDVLVEAGERRADRRHEAHLHGSDVRRAAAVRAVDIGAGPARRGRCQGVHGRQANVQAAPRLNLLRGRVAGSGRRVSLKWTSRALGAVSHPPMPHWRACVPRRLLIRPCEKGHSHRYEQ